MLLGGRHLPIHRRSPPRSPANTQGLLDDPRSMLPRLNALMEVVMETARAGQAVESATMSSAHGGAAAAMAAADKAAAEAASAEGVKA